VCLDSMDVCRFASATTCGGISIYDYSTSSLVGSLPASALYSSTLHQPPSAGPSSFNGAHVCSMFMFRDRIVCGTTNGLIRLFDLRTGKLTYRLGGHVGRVEWIRQHKGVVISSGDDATCRWWGSRRSQVFMSPTLGSFWEVTDVDQGVYSLQRDIKSAFHARQVAETRPSHRGGHRPSWDRFFQGVKFMRGGKDRSDSASDGGNQIGGEEAKSLEETGFERGVWQRPKKRHPSHHPEHVDMRLRKRCTRRRNLRCKVQMKGNVVVAGYGSPLAGLEAWDLRMIIDEGMPKRLQNRILRTFHDPKHGGTVDFDFDSTKLISISDHGQAVVWGWYSSKPLCQIQHYDPEESFKSVVCQFQNVTFGGSKGNMLQTDLSRTWMRGEDMSPTGGGGTLFP